MFRTSGFDLLEGIYGLLFNLYEEVWFRLYHGPVFHRFLNHNFGYYKQLPPKSKMRFLRLVRDHYEYFKWQPRNGMKLTRGHKAIISAAASQLALHLPKECFTFYTSILVYPDYYTSFHTHKVHKGEVNPGFRLIVFSWRGIDEGLEPDDDGLNLLLHEFAHALWLENKLMQHEYQVFDPKLVTQFERQAGDEMVRMKDNEGHFFRRYAFTNMEEFFAVAVENLYERPEKFKSEVPEIFDTLTKMFGQIPPNPSRLINRKKI